MKKNVIETINEKTEELDFSSARKYIEVNLTEVTDQKHKLSRNARGILEHILNQREKGEESLTREEIGEIQVVNTYARRFDVRALKMFLKGKEKLFLKSETRGYLNNDAKTLLLSLGVVEKDIS
ncbi:hypothetical protein [Salimicrobium halophilum]|uniref:Uncharacterized protein n=1 Tax=Salimicrobium halophilum TaxID=86666 RepID=A0A1G8S4G2_9BACI|nr:hypothetical protein [Salimicrobium halophilum]SDJ24107.1 hypothetical protein SAMN04490247_1249 [Salimicrobium halophilum]